MGSTTLGVGGSLELHQLPSTQDTMPPAPPPKPTKCVRKGCGKCLYCMKITAMCECTEEEKAKEPTDVMYGWCHKCREKHVDEYKNLVGNNCTYCGGAIEDNFPPAAIALGILCFPCGIIGCCLPKERQCVKCNRSSA